MINYKLKDEARRLYLDEKWSIMELQNKFGCTMSTAWIPEYFRNDRAERLRAKRVRHAKVMNKASQDAKRKARERKLTQAEKVVFIKHSTKHGQHNAVSQLKQHLECPANKWLMRG